MLSLIVAIIVSLTVGTPTDQPANPNTGNPTEKGAKDKTSDPSLGTMGGVGQWAETRSGS